MMKKKILLSFFALFVAVAVAGIYYFWDMEKQKTFLENQLTTFLQRPVSIQKASLQIFPQPQVILEGIDIKTHEGKSGFMSVKRMLIGLSFSHMFNRLIYLPFLILDHPQITIAREEDNRFNISDLIDNFHQKCQVEKVKSKPWFNIFRFSLRSLTIRNGNLIFKDYSLSPTPSPINIVNLDLKAGKLSTTEMIPVTLSCRLKNEGEDTQINLQGELGPLLHRQKSTAVGCEADLELKNLPISRLCPYLQKWQEIGSVEGIINGKASFKGFSGDSFETSVGLDLINLTLKNNKIFEEEIKIKKTHLSFSGVGDKNKISLTNIKARLPELTVTGRCLLDKTDIPFLETAWEMESFDYQTALPYIPHLFLPKKVRNIMTDNIKGGEITKLSFNYSGKFPGSSSKHKEESTKTVAGSISFCNFSLKIADDFPLIQSLSGELSLKNDEMVINNLTGMFGNSKIEQSRISLSKFAFLDLSADCELDLLDLHKFLHSNIMPPAARKRLMKFSSMSGSSLLKLDISGPINDPGSLSFGGSLKLLKADFDYKTFRKPGKDLYGTIRFTPYLITFSDINGYWANSPVICNGEIENYRTRQSQIRVRVESEAAVINDLTSAFFPWKGVQGTGLVPIEIDFFCQGYRKEKFHFNGSATLKDLSLSFPALPQPFTGINGKMGFSSKGLSFSDVELKADSSELSFSGRWDNLRYPVISGNIEGEFVDFLDFFKPPNLEKKEPSIKYTLDKISVSVKKGRYKDLLFDNLESTVNYHEGVLNFPFLKIENGNCRNFDFVNLNTFRQNSPGSIKYQNGVALIPFLKLEARGGSWIGKEIRLPIWPGTNEEFSIKSEIKAIAIEELLEAFPPEKQNLTGTLTLNADISGEGKDFPERIKTLEGTVRLSVEDGILKRGAILSKVFSLLNVYRIFSKDYYTKLLTQGLYYNTIQGEFQVENGIAKTEGVLLDSPSIKMDLVGAVNLKNRTLDMEIAVQPLETVDKIVEKIPILGTVLMGDEGAIIITYYKVTGTFEEPEVDQVVFQSLGRKAKGIFMRILKLPATILNLEE